MANTLLLSGSTHSTTRLRPAIALLSILLMSYPVCVWPASGGRMGGQSSSSSYSSPSGSSSYSPSVSYDSYSSSSSPTSNSAGTDIDLYTWITGINVYQWIVICLVILVLLRYVFDGMCMEEIRRASTTVFKLQVHPCWTFGYGQVASLDSIAEAADTSKSEGLKYILTETTVVLLRHPHYFVSACSSANVTLKSEDREKWFNQLSIEERAKFDEETLINVDNKRIQRRQPSRTTDGFNNDYIVVSIEEPVKFEEETLVNVDNKLIQRRQPSWTTDGFNNEYIVVTILVAVKGYHMFPTIKGSEDLKQALKMLGCIPSKQIEAVEVLWTPQAKSDTLSEKELHENYPLLKPLQN